MTGHCTPEHICKLNMCPCTAKSALVTCAAPCCRRTSDRAAAPDPQLQAPVNGQEEKSQLAIEHDSDTSIDHVWS